MYYLYTPTTQHVFNASCILLINYTHVFFLVPIYYIKIAFILHTYDHHITILTTYHTTYWVVPRCSYRTESYRKRITIETTYPPPTLLLRVANDWLVTSLKFQREHSEIDITMHTVYIIWYYIRLYYILYYIIWYYIRLYIILYYIIYYIILY